MSSFKNPLMFGEQKQEWSSKDGKDHPVYMTPKYL